VQPAVSPCTAGISTPCMHDQGKCSIHTCVHTLLLPVHTVHVLTIAPLVGADCPRQLAVLPPKAAPQAVPRV